jgi:hypothetical protein
MAEVYRNSQSPVSHQIFWNGDIAVPNSLPSVKLFDITEDPAIDPQISPTTVLTTLTPVVDENNPGVYTAYIPYQYTNRNRTFRLRWDYAIGSTNVEHFDDVFVITPYADLNHIDDLGFSTDSSDPNYRSYRELVKAEKYARKQIENYTGQKFYLYDDVQVVYGYGAEILPLSAKLYDLHELYAADQLLVDNINDINNWGYEVIISETGYGIRINRANLLDNTVYTANGMVPPTIHDTYGIFKSNVPYKVQGRFGWDNVPDDVELACVELMKDYFSKDTVWKNKYVKNISTFDWDFEYTSDAYAGTGNAYADRLLSGYVMVSKVEVI